jgi:hypothetical protein
MGSTMLQKLPNYADEVSYSQIFWHEKLCPVQEGQLLFAIPPLNNYGNLVWVLFPDLLHITHTLG